jgi:hypothetical protein
MNILDFVHCIPISAQLYLDAWTGNEKSPVQITRPKETSDNNKRNRSCKMNFLPKTAPKNLEGRQDLLTILFAIPLSLLGTASLFALVDLGGRSLGV